MDGEVDGAEAEGEEVMGETIHRLRIARIPGRDMLLDKGRRDGGLVSGVVRWEARRRGIWRAEDRDSSHSLCRTTVGGLEVVVRVVPDRQDLVGVDRVLLGRGQVLGMRVRVLGLRVDDSFYLER